MRRVGEETRAAQLALALLLLMMCVCPTSSYIPAPDMWSATTTNAAISSAQHEQHDAQRTERRSVHHKWCVQSVSAICCSCWHEVKLTWAGHAEHAPELKLILLHRSVTTDKQRGAAIDRRRRGALQLWTTRAVGLDKGGSTRDTDAEKLAGEGGPHSLSAAR